jgi:hypothetical protein
MAILGDDNIFLRIAQIPLGFIAVVGILVVVALALSSVLDFLIVLKSRMIKPRLGKILVSEGYITKEELEGALLLQRMKFGEILISENCITRDQLNEALDIQKKVSMKIGEILKEMGYVTEEDIDLALAKMKRRIGRVLLDMGLVSENNVGWALSRQRKPVRF